MLEGLELVLIYHVYAYSTVWFYKGINVSYAD